MHVQCAYSYTPMTSAHTPYIELERVKVKFFNGALVLAHLMCIFYALFLVCAALHRIFFLLVLLFQFICFFSLLFFSARCSAITKRIIALWAKWSERPSQIINTQHRNNTHIFVLLYTLGTTSYTLHTPHNFQQCIFYWASICLFTQLICFALFRIKYLLFFICLHLHRVWDMLLLPLFSVHNEK